MLLEEAQSWMKEPCSFFVVSLEFCVIVLEAGLYVHMYWFDPLFKVADRKTTTPPKQISSLS